MDDSQHIPPISVRQKRIIPLSVIINESGPEVAVFNVDDIKTLRDDYGILGVLIGTLAQYPQQNVFLSVPLRLMLWEVIWLVESNHAILVDYKNYRRNLPVIPSSNLVSLTKSGVVDGGSPNFIVTHNEHLRHDDEVLKQHQISLSSYVQSYLAHYNLSPNQLVSNYQYFKYLKNKDFYISPGLKFGGDLVIYPGDPLKYHSYSIVKFSFFNLNDIIVGGRLASGVKKTMLLIDTKEQQSIEESPELVVTHLFENNDIMAFSIEWAGFG
jgi:tRNA-splicing endonuclease subunit Sen34